MDLLREIYLRETERGEGRWWTGHRREREMGRETVREKRGWKRKERRESSLFIIIKYAFTFTFLIRQDSCLCTVWDLEGSTSYVSAALCVAPHPWECDSICHLLKTSLSLFPFWPPRPPSGPLRTPQTCVCTNQPTCNSRLLVQKSANSTKVG